MTDQEFLNDFKRAHIKKSYGSPKKWNQLTLPDRSKGHGWTEATTKTTMDICYWLWTHGIAFMQEVPMIHDKHIKGSRRVDIVAPELYESQIIEIHDSESMESIEAKKQQYLSHGLTFIAVPADTSTAIQMIQAKNGLEEQTQ